MSIGSAFSRYDRPRSHMILCDVCCRPVGLSACQPASQLPCSSLDSCCTCYLLVHLRMVRSNGTLRVTAFERHARGGWGRTTLPKLNCLMSICRDVRLSLGHHAGAKSQSKVAGRQSTVRRREERGATPDDVENTELKMLTSNLDFDQDVRLSRARSLFPACGALRRVLTWSLRAGMVLTRCVCFHRSMGRRPRRL